MDRSRSIFGNPIDERTYQKACRNQEKLLRKYSDDRNANYLLYAEPAPIIGPKLGVEWLKLCPAGTAAYDTLVDPATGAEQPAVRTPTSPVDWESVQQPCVIGNIRMGFGHYRIAMAMASAARALGCTPLWFDLCAFDGSTCSAVINEQNKLYSMGSRISQKSHLFNRVVWDPLNSEGFKKLTYNAGDQKTAELFAPVYHSLPKDVPFVGTHAWASQGAVHAGLTHVVNAIPDNWPMALHYAEGSIHTVQTPFAYEGYLNLSGMAKGQLKPMPSGSLFEVGHYVDHELVVGIPDDCAARINRAEAHSPIRYLICVGGAGAQQNLIAGIIRHLIPCVDRGEATLLINVGDHADVWKALKTSVPALHDAIEHVDDYSQVEAVCRCGRTDLLDGIHAFCHKDTFAAVYSTNELMRICDILVTKPGELAFYPVPKMMIRRVGGHEAYNALRSHEVGDGTEELDSLGKITAYIDRIQADREPLVDMCNAILVNNAAGLYNGAYKVIQLALQ